MSAIPREAPRRRRRPARRPPTAVPTFHAAPGPPPATIARLPVERKEHRQPREVVHARRARLGRMAGLLRRAHSNILRARARATIFRSSGRHEPQLVPHAALADLFDASPRRTQQCSDFGEADRETGADQRSGIGQAVAAGEQGLPLALRDGIGLKQGLDGVPGRHCLDALPGGPGTRSHPGARR